MQATPKIERESYARGRSSACDSECEQILAELREAIHDHVRFLQESTKELQTRESERAASADNAAA
jgi:hypothetical protein